MKNKLVNKLTEIYKTKKNKKRLKTVFFSLAAIVIFITSYSLILPAITAEINKAKENDIAIEEPILDPSQPREQVDTSPLVEALEKARKFLEKISLEKGNQGLDSYGQEELEKFKELIKKLEELVQLDDIDQLELDKALEDLKKAKEELEASRQLGLEDKEDQELDTGEDLEESPEEELVEEEIIVDEKDQEDIDKNLEGQEPDQEESEEEENKEEEVIKDREDLDLKALERQIQACKDRVLAVEVSEERPEDVKKGQVYYNKLDLDKFRSAIAKAEEILKKEGLSQEDLDLELIELILAREEFAKARKQGLKEEGLDIVSPSLKELKDLIKEARQLILDAKISELAPEELEKDKIFYSQEDLDKFKKALEEVEAFLLEEDLSQEELDLKIIEFKLDKEALNQAQKLGLRELEDKKENIRIKSAFGPLYAEVELVQSELAKEDLRLELETLVEKPKKPLLAFRSALSLIQGQEPELDYNKYRELLDKKYNNQLEDLLLYDMSIYSKEGDYIEVKSQANVSLSMIGQGIKKEVGSDIKLIHFKEEPGKEIELIEIEAEVELAGEEVSKLSFQTQGFSVFAVIKIGSWTEASLPEGEYTIITPTDNNQYMVAGIERSLDEFEDPIGLKGETLNENDIEPRPSGVGTERPFQFKDLDARENYDRFLISQESGNRYTIKDLEKNLYFAIQEDGVFTYNVEKFYFKFYIDSNQPDKFIIHTAEGSNNKPIILVYNKAENKYEAVSKYETDDDIYPYHQFIKNEKRLWYRLLSSSEINNLAINKKYEFVIVSQSTTMKTNDIRSMRSSRLEEKYINADGISRDMDKYDLDSTSMIQEGNRLYVNPKDLYRDFRFLEPDMWIFTRRGDGSFNIQDDKGNYARIKNINPERLTRYYVELVPEAQVDPSDDSYRYIYEPNNDLFRNQANGKRAFNLKDGGTSWHTWGGTPPNNKIGIAVKEHEKSIKDTVSSKPELVEAIVPDGDYFIADEYANFVLDNRTQNNYLRSDKSKDYNNTLKEINGNNPRGSNIFYIRRQADGTYRITKHGEPDKVLQITNQQYDNYDYKRIYLKSNIEQENSQNIKIATIEKDPGLFYIYNDFGSLQFHYWANNNDFGTSIVGGLGKPLRLYRVDNLDTGKNHRFNHQEKAPTEKLANIPDGAYVIGNSPNIHRDFIDSPDPNYINPEDPTDKFNNKQDLSTLQADTSTGKAWIHYNENSTLDNEEFHMIEKKDDFIGDLSQWTFTQTDQPGHYFIKTGNAKLSLSDSGIMISEANNQPVNIYKREGVNDQILITQGNYRLRFDGTWVTVANSEPLSEADYHYIGKKIDDYLSFKLTNPDTEKRLKATGESDINAIGGENSWINNVRLMEKVWVRDLEGNLDKNKPKGEFQELGPIGQAHEKRYPNLFNPYRGLYRIALNERDLDEGIKTGGLVEGKNHSEDILANHYKEYDFLGWKVELNGKSYIIDEGQGNFTKVEEGIIIPANQSKILGADGSLTVNSSQLTIPYKSTLESYWQELSAPIYFKYIHQEGIMDIERAMSAKTLLERENANISPILGAGRLFFPEYKAFDFAGTRAETMDYQLGRRFHSVQSLDFSGTTKNQINMNYFAHVEETTGTTVNNEVIFDKNPQPLGKNAMEGDAIDWLREANKKLSIIRQLGDDKIELVEELKKDKNTFNYGINLLDIQENASGNFLKGIVYAKTTEVQIEKDFEGLADEDIDNLLQAHINSAGDSKEAFNLKLKVNNQGLDQVFYKLSASKNPDNAIASGIAPLTYDQIEKLRVYQAYDSANHTFSWSVRLPLGQKFTVLEENFDLKDYFAPAGQDKPKYDIFTRLQEYKLGQGNPIDKLGNFPYGTASSLASNLLDSDENKYIRFNNLYANGGLVLLSKKGEQTDQMIRGIEFKLYRADKSWKKEAQPMVTELTGNNGNISFRNLTVGNYVLVETYDANSIYEEVPEFRFTIKAETLDDGTIFYKMIRQDSPKIEVIEPGYDQESKLNKLQVTNKLKTDTLIIEKNFEGIVRRELEEVFKNFKIHLKGQHGENTYTKTLTYDNADIANYGNSVTWYVNALDPEAGKSVSIVDFDNVEISETGYEHNNYPVVKRRAWLNETERDITEYPYNIKPIKDQTNKFKLNNIYTDTFEMVIEVYGRDKEYSHHLPVRGMGFQIYGGIDEANHGKPFITKEIDGTTYYLLEKPKLEFSEDLQEKFFTDSDGFIKSIYNLAYIKNNEYLLYQSDNPKTGFDIEGREVIFYPIEPIRIKLEGDGINLRPSVLGLENIKGKSQAEYQNGLLYIKIDLDRTNYRLPETGGQGRQAISIASLILILGSSSLLVYRKRKLKLKGERK